MGARDLRLSQLDVHCDLRGLTIDRTRQLAHVHDPRELEHVDQGNLLTGAIHAGMVRERTSAHHPFGGQRDDLGTVRERTDQRTRLGSPTPDLWQPLAYLEVDLHFWNGPQEGAHLDLDWDGLACRLYPKDFVRALQQGVLDRDFRWRPEVVGFIYSDCRSHIDDDAFDNVLDALRRKLDATVERLSPLPPNTPTGGATLRRPPPLAGCLRAPRKAPSAGGPMP
ncbi:MAG: hypothetical protein CL927_08445 [Deltaproteobacteria bacterium]|nr:hypothetical protein [Deltaproteobacteria bacterium]